MATKKYEKFIEYLRHELEPALGCTEPIAVAYASALAARVLGEKPKKIIAKCSPNIIKNVKGVIVPNSDGEKGIQVAAILGALGGDDSKNLEVLESVTKENVAEAKELMKTDYCVVEILIGVENLHIIMEVFGEKDQVTVEIKSAHTNVVRIEKNGVDVQKGVEITEEAADTSFLNVEDILDFSQNVPLEELGDIIENQIKFNKAIAEEGMHSPWGESVGETIQEVYGNSVEARAKYMAAAGSDARMAGCTLPVVINSGSGNQGITVSLPIIEYAKEFKVSHEKLVRALLVSNLMALYVKSKIGKLSAYCGAVGAGSGVGAGITYLAGGNKQQIIDTITNTLASISGIICDGAKGSCAFKIASSVDAAILSYHMAMDGRVFPSGEGIVKDTIEETVNAVGKIAKIGMKETDEVVLRVMLDQE